MGFGNNWWGGWQWKTKFDHVKSRGAKEINRIVSGRPNGQYFNQRQKKKKTNHT